MNVQKALQHIKKRPVLHFLTVMVLDIAFFSTTDPSKVAAPWLIVGYILAVATLYWVVRALVAFLGLYSKGLRRQKKRFTKVLTLTGAILLAMQSVGQLSLRDIAMIVPLALLSYFYFTYGRSKREA
ncbi:MAG TPA: hypothetical protein VFI84_01540 [Candidatus Saccharimonadales bacterium]|nr:hypothetical protein [Candidatus Saccharimonadales bacterium]